MASTMKKEKSRYIWDVIFRFTMMRECKRLGSSCIHIMQLHASNVKQIQILQQAYFYLQDAESQFFLGECYKEGLECLPQDLDAALEYFEMARKNGCQQAEEHITGLKEQINKLEFGEFKDWYIEPNAGCIRYYTSFI